MYADADADADVRTLASIGWQVAPRNTVQQEAAAGCSVDTRCSACRVQVQVSDGPYVGADGNRCANAAERNKVLILA